VAVETDLRPQDQREKPLNELCLAVRADQALLGSGDPEFFLRMVAGSADRFAYLDRGLVYRAANAAYLKSWEATADAVIGHSVEDVMDRDDFEEVRPKLEACLAGKTVVYEVQLPRRGAQTGWGEVTYRPWVSAEGLVEGIVVCVHDITARKAAQSAIERLTRLYRTLSECNQAILHCEDAASLFPILCRLLVTHGGLSVAWIGQVEEASGRVECLAVESKDEQGAALVKNLVPSIDVGDQGGDDPIRRAIQDASGYWSLDFQSDPVTRSWHSLGRKLEWRASASIPLKECGRVVAVLSVYAQDPEILDDDAQKLLSELVCDVSYALDHFAAINQLAHSEERWKFALEGNDAGVWDWDLTTNRVFYSHRWKSMLGLSDDEVRDGVDECETRVHPDDLDQLMADLERHLRGETQSYQSEHRVRHKDGRYLWILDRGKIVKRAADGSPMRMIGTHTDITARRDARDALLRLGEIVESSQTEVYVFDPETLCFEQVNQGARDNLGYSMDELALMTPVHLKPDYDAKSFARLIEPLRKGTKTQVVLETRHRRKDGTCYPAEIRLQLLGRQPRFVALVTDVTERQRAEEAIKHLAFFDPLTGLPNRRLLTDRLERAVASTRRSDRLGALIFIDLDDFKTLNDTLGHDQGDLLLRQVAKRLSSCIRETDTLARLGGDEFVVILERLSDVAEQAAVQAESVGNKMLNALREPCGLEGLEYRCSASMGVTLFGRRVVRVEELMKQADLAMYRAKASGRDTLCFFDPTMQAEVTARAALAANLRQGLQKDEFILHYQTQVDGEGRVRGVEGLLRWQHPKRGLLEPSAFIALAEETAVILPLGQWVLEMACAQLALWSQCEDTADLTLAVNVSVRQFHQADFVDQVLSAIDHSGCDPSRLKLEITENLLRDDPDTAIAKMSALQARGVTFALDDFGTGYSSLSDLKRLPLKELKIDRSFVNHLGSDENDAAIARTIIALGGTLDLDVIAEGVETEAQRDWLVGQGCHAFQGYLFGRPGPAGQSGGMVLTA
jgi:diguanylate cyclase (GGDEF)-like protein/PAS domain S-box-containing protein